MSLHRRSLMDDEGDGGQDYVAEKGDTIHSLAVKFNISPHRIQLKNPHIKKSITPGTILSIESSDVAETGEYSFFAVLQRPDTDRPGLITFNETIMTFCETNTSLGLDPVEIKINLIGLIQTTLIPHPALKNIRPDLGPEDPTRPSVLTAIFLNDVFDQSSVMSASFNGLRSELSPVNYHMNRIGKGLRDSCSFVLPKMGLMAGQTMTFRNPKRISINPFKIVGPASDIVEQRHIDCIRLAMPIRYRQIPWKRLFAINRDGVSFTTMYSKISKHNIPMVLLVRTATKDVFGAFVSGGMKVSKHFTGTGETFVFTVKPKMAVYKWNKGNTRFLACSETDIMIGGPRSAIYIGPNFRNGSSDFCETFMSPPLCSTKDQFGIISFEVWGVSASW